MPMEHQAILGGLVQGISHSYGRCQTATFQVRIISPRPGDRLAKDLHLVALSSCSARCAMGLSTKAVLLTLFYTAWSLCLDDGIPPEQRLYVQDRWCCYRGPLHVESSLSGLRPWSCHPGVRPVQYTLFENHARESRYASYHADSSALWLCTLSHILFRSLFRPKPSASKRTRKGSHKHWASELLCHEPGDLVQLGLSLGPLNASLQLGSGQIS